SRTRSRSYRPRVDPAGESGGGIDRLPIGRCRGGCPTRPGTSAARSAGRGTGAPWGRGPDPGSGPAVRGSTLSASPLPLDSRPRADIFEAIDSEPQLGEPREGVERTTHDPPDAVQRPARRPALHDRRDPGILVRRGWSTRRVDVNLPFIA